MYALEREIKLTASSSGRRVVLVKVRRISYCRYGVGGWIELVQP